MNKLVVFPTELAMRRYQQEQALKHGWVDASCHTTFSRLLKLCLPYAAVKGSRLDGVQHLLMRRQVIEVASGHFAGRGALGDLSDSALGDVLDKLLVELASMPGEATRIIDWLLDHHRKNKLYQLGTLISVWRAMVKQEGAADQLDVHLAILKLLKGNREKWPPLLRDCRQLTFKAVRWFNPFEESCVAALNHKLKVRIGSAMPPAHAEAAADRLGQQIRSEIMAEPWAVWAEDLGDALAVDSPDVLQLADSSRINFSRSAGAYGEIEDLARRICWEIQSCGVAPNRLALVVPNIGAVQDIVPHVFSRFGIPYFFRRGRPVLSSPVVKAFFAWLAFPLRPERDTMIDLVRNPALKFEDREQVVDGLLDCPPRLDGQAGKPARSGAHALEILEEKIIEPEDHFNAEALKAVESALEGFGEQALPLNELVDLLEEFLENTTVRPRDSHEQGVWILNPHDAVGLDFDVVLFAGLNEGGFPAVPQQDALLSDAERHFLRLHLEGQGRRLPKMALPKADVFFEQQSVMFLTALGMAREQLVLSFQAVDQEGNEKGGGEYYRKLWNLAGWCARDEIEPSPYDRWRMGLLPADHVFSNHLETQRKTAPEDREPMPGESFLPIVPLPLCRAQDEALQSAVQQGRQDACGTKAVTQASRLLPAKHVVDMLKIEAEREAFLETELDERRPSTYCGHISALKGKVADWFALKEEMSPTALEALAQCRYVFLLERVFGIRDPRVADDTPDPAERGQLIHAILQEVYKAIALGQPGIGEKRLWAVKAGDGWKLRAEDGLDALPLAVFEPSLAAEYEAFATRIANQHMDKTALGHAGIWAADRRKVLEQVLNVVRHDAATSESDNRYPALFETWFGGDTAVDLGEVRLHGVIDRVDLIFSHGGELEKLRVLDYKGSSRSRNKAEEYIDDIRRNLDCQLPVYAFAAQQFFFGEFNTPQANAMTETGYHIYQRKLDDVARSLKKSIIAMDEKEMVEAFLDTLFSNLRRLKDGDFAVDPLVEAYTDYSSVCRTEAVARDELE